jgi:hypothetical protein
MRTALLCVALASPPAGAAEISPSEILKQAAAAEKANARRAWNYVYQEDRSAGGKKLTYDGSFLEGLPYRRLIARGGRTLSRKEARSEQQKMDQEAARRAAESPDERRRRVFQHPQSYRIPFAELPEICDLKPAGVELRSGRPAWRIEAEPRPDGAFPRWRQTLWIDQQDVIRAAFEAVLLDDSRQLKRGSRVRMEKFRDAAGVWLPARNRVEYVTGDGCGATKSVYHDYRRFESDSVLLPLGEVDVP